MGDAGTLDFTIGKNFEPPRILVYGGEGVGKSSFAAGARKPIFLDLERGLEQIGPPRLPPPRNFTEFTHQIRRVHTMKHDRETLVIDTVDALERLIHEHVCRESGATNIGAACGGYGKGYTEAETVLEQVTQSLDALRLSRGMAIVLLCHSKVEKYESPDHPTYDRHSPALHKAAAALVTEWCDVVGFAARRLRVEEKEAGFNRSRGIAKPMLDREGRDRSLRVDGGPAVIAKTRYTMPPEIPLSWAVLDSHISKAMEDTNTNNTINNVTPNELEPANVSV